MSHSRKIVPPSPDTDMHTHLIYYSARTGASGARSKHIIITKHIYPQLHLSVIMIKYCWCVMGAAFLKCLMDNTRTARVHDQTILLLCKNKKQ